MIPALSVILAASGGYPAIRATVQRLKRQEAASSLELVIIAMNGPAEVPPHDAAPFHSITTVTLPAEVSVAAANAEGVRRASAPIVVFGEDHCFPDPGWAQALIDAHQQPYAVVGPVFRNGNPGSVVSWCDFLIAYSAWMDPSPAGLRPFLPGHNSSYKRGELLAYGPQLAEKLEAETVLHYEMSAAGRQLFLEPKARVAHLNFAQFPIWTKVQFYGGWRFGGYRAASWPLPRKLFYAAASPLIPLVRFARIARELLLPGRPSSLLLRIAPMLWFGLAIDGLGQFLGYLTGPGRSAEILSDFEYNRVRFLSLADRKQVLSPDA